MAPYYSLRDILTIAATHPFYSSSLYPLSPDAIAHTLACKDPPTSTPFSTWPLLHKRDLYKSVERLCADVNPDNTYRISSYASATGGGSGLALSMMFLTDSVENQNQRTTMALLMKACKVIEPSDWILNLHSSGNFYRAMDLTTEVYERAGGTVLCAGCMISREQLVAACLQFHINVITADSTQIVAFAKYVATLSPSTRSLLRISKIIYTCEMLGKTKRKYITSILGPVMFYSFLASAEAGPYGVANYSLTGDPTDDIAADFIIDTRAMHVEIFPLTATEVPDSDSSSEPGRFKSVAEGTLGLIVLTSLHRLRNPLVRYVSGDVGSLHPLPSSVGELVDPDMAPHLRVLRLHGRDQRFSFKWLGEYHEFDELDRVMRTESFGVLQWQLVLEQVGGTDYCELRVFRRPLVEGSHETIVSDAGLIQHMQEFFKMINFQDKHHLRIVSVKTVNDFERSATSNKVIRFIDRTHSKPGVGRPVINGDQSVTNGNQSVNHQS